MTNWVVILERETTFESVGGGALVRLPDSLRRLVLSGKELGKLFLDLPQEFQYQKELGPIGYLTQGRFTRMQAMETSLKLAVAPILQKELYRLDIWGDQ